MKKLTTAILTCGLLASSLHRADAATMRLSADGGATWTLVEDNGPLDKDSTVGSILYVGSISGWSLVVSTAFGTGNAVTPRMDLGGSFQSSGPANLIVQMSDTNFIAFPNETFVASLSTTTAGSVTYKTYQDTGNVLFGSLSAYPGDPAGISPSPTAASLITEGPYVGGPNTPSNSVVVPGASGLYSLTLETTISHPSAGITTSDALLFPLAPPPQCNCVLTFNSPTSITNCAGDAIPDVVASEDCGNGPTPVTVTFVGAGTNGVCPQIITRTNSAKDDCGTVSTFVQTITVNCTPDCTITMSTTNAMVGGSNYTASVADAGAGASYDWNILNGTITAGLNTTNITWAAGTDTNSPITIVVTVKTAAGCQSTCSAGAHLSPQPPRIGLGAGDAATIGFWHNKNGQALILSAPNSPALGNWLGNNFPCMFGSLKGKSNADVAAAFMTDFNVKGTKTYAQVLAGAFAVYFTSSTLAGNGAAQYGFNVTPGGTGAKLFNVGNLGTTIGLQNNQSYTVLQILQAANSKCPFNSAVFNALNTIFDGINTTGDIK